MEKNLYGPLRTIDPKRDPGKLAQTVKIFKMADGKEGEGQAEFFSHHVQSLRMGPKDNAMTRYWQY